MNDIAPLMTGAGFNAVKEGALDEAGHIFASVAELNPKDAAGMIGQATVQLSLGDIPAAIAVLEGGIEQAEVNVHEARKLLLLAYMLEGDDAKAEQLHSQFVLNSEREDTDDHLHDASVFFNQASA